VELCTNNIEESSTTDMDDFEEISKALHVFLMPKNNANNCQTRSFSFADHSSIICLEQSNTALLRKLVHCISAGEKLSHISSSQINQSYQKQRNASFLAANLLHTLKGDRYHGSKLKEIISNNLYIGNVSESMIQFFSFLGLSCSKKYLTLSTGKAVQDKLK
jgi:hypothetical protein